MTGHFTDAGDEAQVCHALCVVAIGPWEPFPFWLFVLPELERRERKFRIDVELRTNMFLGSLSAFIRFFKD